MSARSWNSAAPWFSAFERKRCGKYLQPRRAAPDEEHEEQDRRHEQRAREGGPTSFNRSPPPGAQSASRGRSPVRVPAERGPPAWAGRARRRRAPPGPGVRAEARLRRRLRPRNRSSLSARHGLRSDARTVLASLEPAFRAAGQEACRRPAVPACTTVPIERDHYLRLGPHSKTRFRVIFGAANNAAPRGLARRRFPTTGTTPAVRPTPRTGARSRSRIQPFR